MPPSQKNSANEFNRNTCIFVLSTFVLPYFCAFSLTYFRASVLPRYYEAVKLIRFGIKCGNFKLQGMNNDNKQS